MKASKNGGKFTLIFIAVLIASFFAMCTNQGTEKAIEKVTEETGNAEKPPKSGENESGTDHYGQKNGEKKNVSQIQFSKFSIFYYYHPLCPNCQKIKPYMELMKNVTEIDACNVGNLSSCSPESIEMLNLLRSQGKFLGVPTIAVLEGNDVTLLIGWKQALKLGEIIEKHGITPPPVTYNNTTYTVQECVECHSVRGLKPPSTFNCTYCCHTGEGEGQEKADKT